jgi:hypothetical protein
MLIWAAFIVAGFLCAPLLRWQGFVITTFLVIILYWSIVGLPVPTIASYAISFVLIVLAMQIGYIAGLLATAGIGQLRHDAADSGSLRPAMRVKKASDEPGAAPTRIETGPASSPRAE